MHISFLPIRLTATRSLLKNFLIPWLLWMVLSFPCFLRSETIYFKNGEKWEGTILDQDRNQILFQHPDGRIETLQKTDIRKIDYKDENATTRPKPIQKSNEDQEREWAEIYSKAITPLPREWEETQEVPLLPTPFSDPSQASPLYAEGAAIRSLFFPGWGQFYQGREYAGYVYSSLAVIGLYSYYRQNQIYRNALRDYQRITNPTPSLLTESLLVGGTASLRPEFYGWLPVEPSLGAGYILIQQEFSPAGLQKKAVNRHLQTRENLGYALAALWIVSSLDAYFFHPDYHITILPLLDSHQGNSLGLHFSIEKNF